MNRDDEKKRNFARDYGISGAELIAASHVACGTCGEPTTLPGAQRCNGCWEVEHRLADYFRRGGGKAVAFTLRAVIQAYELETKGR